MTSTMSLLAPLAAVLRCQLHRALESGEALCTEQLRRYLEPVYEAQTPSTPWLQALLATDECLMALPDDRWVKIAAVTDGRAFTTRLSATDRTEGRLRFASDLQLVALRYAGWSRVPVQVGPRRYLAPLDEDGIRVPSDALPAVGLIALTPGPEGVVVRSARVDQAADARVRRVLARVRSVGTRGTVARAEGPVAAEVLVLLLSCQPELARAPVTPLSELLDPPEPAVA